MSRQRRTPEENSEDRFRAEVRIRQGYYDLMSQRALAAETGIPQGTLSKRLAQPENFTVAELRKLVGTIVPDPVAVLKLLGYTDRDLKRLRAPAE